MQAITSNLVSIIIPIYKERLNNNELLSLKQCLKVLKEYPILFIGPDKLDTSEYEKICDGHITFKITRFADFYFEGIEGYNQLMLSPNLYKSFFKYRYMLIYQLDAYVFKDELLYWCQQKYDFIGAPNSPHQNIQGEIQFLKGYSRFIKIVNGIFKTNHHISNVGNGGFSLRKTKTCYFLLKILKTKIPAWGVNNEDGFFKYWGNLLYPFFKLPSDEIALHFSIERYPEECLKKLGNKLPFGCHAFEKYEPEIWKQYIHDDYIVY